MRNLFLYLVFITLFSITTFAQSGGLSFPVDFEKSCLMCVSNNTVDHLSTNNEPELFAQVKVNINPSPKGWSEYIALVSEFDIDNQQIKKFKYFSFRGNNEYVHSIYNNNKLTFYKTGFLSGGASSNYRFVLNFDTMTAVLTLKEWTKWQFHLDPDKQDFSADFKCKTFRK